MNNFIRACKRQPVEQVPVWYMRQAGRSQAEYRKIKESHTLMEIVKNPKLCAEVTMLPVNEYDVDGAILFSDIMTPLEVVGIDFEIKAGVGPVIQNKIVSLDDVNKIGTINLDKDLTYVTEAIKLIKSQTVKLDKALIGFSGAPFTLASYLIEGGPSKNHVKTKLMMYEKPDVWFALMKKLEKVVIDYLILQIEAGVDAIQIFDSWAGALGRDDYKEYVMPTVKNIFSELKKYDVGKIYFGINTGELLTLFKEYDLDVIGIDWHASLEEASAKVGNDFAIQGNLDPVVLLGPWEEIERRAKKIIDVGIKHKGFIFNLGHGVMPETDEKVLVRLTKFIHDYSRSVLKK